MSEIYIGLDPGSGGGIALLTDTTVSTRPLGKMTFRDMWDFLKEATTNNSAFAVLEKVGGFMGPEAGEDGKKRNRAAAHMMFNFGYNAGALEAFLIAANIRYEHTPPQRWVKGLGISPRKATEGKGEWKNRLKAAAQRLFPDIRVTLATSDALLLAEYARRISTGKVATNGIQS